MKKLILPLLFLTINLQLYGQNINISYDLDTAIYKVKDPLDLWLNFLKTGDDSTGAKYWNTTEVTKYGKGNYFLIENEVDRGTNNYLRFLKMAAVINIMTIRKSGEYYKIKYSLNFKESNGNIITEEIYNVFAGYENGVLKLFNPLPINTKLYCNSTTVGFIKYHYPRSHVFNHELAKKQIDFIADIAQKFKVKPDTIDYYFASTLEELLRIRGWDYRVGMSGEEIPTGIADVKNKIVFCYALEEYCPHEILHIYLNPKYSNTHYWLLEGLATYLDGSRGYNLDWHLTKINKHLAAHPEIDLNNMLQYRTLDQYTDYRYALGGLLIKLAFEKGNYELLDKFLNTGKTSKDFYATIENNLGIKLSDLNTFLRKELATRYK